MKSTTSSTIQFLLKQAPNYLLMFVVLLTSCDSLVGIVDQDKLPEIQSKLVVESYISPQSPTIEVKVTESLPLYGEDKIDPVYIKNAVVTISGEAGRLTIPYNDSTLSYLIDSSAFGIESGKTYELTVSDERRSVKARTRVPDKIVLLKSYRIDTVPGEFDPLLAARVRFSWDDIKGETNFYSMRGYATTEETTFIYDPVTLKSSLGRQQRQTPFYDYLKEIVIFSDINQDGITLTSPESTFSLPMDYKGTYIGSDGKEYPIDTDPKIAEIHVEILHLNESYYKFYQTLRDSDHKNNPFAEPLLIYNNIEGGLGCFGAYTVGINKITF
ncbi:DUF4249 domain-containing protein [Dyadobacter pollutisoli]|uniref:DUF4249 domain-containing protein n=1 Tax=Dyadobacter pollutisoli TaxID=2910158 RepID=A0A9E8NAF5_9BACT|nr:DUF4249 domain-containing protein [Dyadobacter pollutisoli]WAC12994.1 DUF4249 domain-containing protein [Dyadobacter pollutisoli]